MENVANIGQTFKAEFERQVEAEYSKLSRANVLIAGHTGAGKSKLINAVLGTELARVGSGAPVTDCYTRYSVNSVPVVIFDAKGWEGGTEKEHHGLRV
jgi:predicted GTPase